MIDKTIPYVKLQMEKSTSQALPDRQLPEGYQFCFYTPGDERDWQDIETSVGEFDNLSEAQRYFEKSFAPYPDELAKRMTFLLQIRLVKKLLHVQLGGQKKESLSSIGWLLCRKHKGKG